MESLDDTQHLKDEYSLGPQKKETRKITNNLLENSQNQEVVET